MKLQLAFALVIALVTFPNLVTRCPAHEQEVALAALPEAGSPPAPVATSAIARVAAPASDDNKTEDDNKKAVDNKTEDSTTSPSKPEPVEPATELPPADAAIVNAATIDATADATAEVATPADVAEVRELSVAPDSKPLLPRDRPAWVGDAPDLSSNTHRLFVGSYPTLKPEEADAALDDPLVASVNGYIDEYVLKNGGAEKLGLKADWIRGKLVDRTTDYLAELSTSQGPMYQKWVVVQISPENRHQLLEQYRQVEQVHRLVALGLGVTGLMTLTGLANVAFKRRRRRYDGLANSNLLPGIYPLAAKSQPPVLKRTGHRTGWGLLGFAVLMVVLFIVPFGLWSVRHVRQEASHSASVRNVEGPVRIVEGTSEGNPSVVESKKRSRRTTTRITTAPGNRTVEIHSENY